MPTIRQQKITLAEMRASGVRGLLIYCGDYTPSYLLKKATRLGLSIKRQAKGK